MEVHHHPEVGHKSFKEYLLEGLMIFIAVTLGFLAESLREHMHDASKEQTYVVSLAQDLRADTARIDQAVTVEWNELRKSDTLMRVVLQPPTDTQQIRKAYTIMGWTLDQENVMFTTRTYDELKSSGDMRLIRADSVVAALQTYIQDVATCEDQDQYYGRQISVMAEAANRIFLTRFRYSALTEGHVLPDDGTPIRFATTDPVLFNEYGSRLLFFQGVVISYARMIAKQRDEAVALLKLLHREYDID